MGGSMLARGPGRAMSVLMLASSALALSAGMALAGPLPSGGAVASGTASITSPLATQLTINQTSAKAILTWNTFSIGAGNTVQFNNGSGATLNRVTGTGASQIDGSLLATGSVYLVNPNGIVIGKTGVVNTGGTFVASSLDISNSAFLAGGALNFSGTSTASVINLGQIGSTGGDVVLAAQTVENERALNASAGDVGLLAGSKVTLSDTLASNGKFSVTLGSGSSVTNNGQITAAIAELRVYGGNIYALAGNGGGAITATGVATNDGQVFLTAAAAFGATGVGDITISGGVGFSGGANALTIDAFHNAQILTPISTSGGHVALTANDGGVGGDYSFGLGDSGFPGALRFTGGAASGESLTIKGRAYTLLYSITDVQNISANAANAYALAGNIDASATMTWNGGSGFSPITSSTPYETSFSGVLEGLGNTISHLFILNTSAQNVGLITTSDGVVRDIGLVGAKITGSAMVGGLVGTVTGGTLSQVYTTGSITAVNGVTGVEGSVGGLVGFNQGQVEQSFSTATVSQNVTTGIYDAYAGGLVGDNDSYIDNSHAMGAVTAATNAGEAGGIAGRNRDSITGSYATSAVSAGFMAGGLTGENDGDVLTSYATGDVSNAFYSGGLIGFNRFGYVVDSYATGSVSGPYQVGGLIGSSVGTIIESYATGAVTCGCSDPNGLDYAGGLVGANFGSIDGSYASGQLQGPAGQVGGLVGISNDGFDTPGRATNSYWDVQTSGQSTSAGGVGLTTAQFANASNFTGFTFTTTPNAGGWVIVDQDGTLNNAGGAAGATRPLLADEYSTTITNGHQLQLMAMNLGAAYTLSANLSLAEIANPAGAWITAEGFSPLGSATTPFSGSFDGEGHAIDGLNVAGAAADLSAVGLFAVTGATSLIDNVNLTNVSISSMTYNSAATAEYIGGLVGHNFGSILQSSASGRITLTAAYSSPDADAGLLAGANEGTISGSQSAGGLVLPGFIPEGGSDLIAAVNTNVGGLVGANTGVIEQSSSSAELNVAAAVVGGLIGWNSGSVGGSYATGAVTNSVWEESDSAGGLIGNNEGSVTAAYATGAIYAESHNTGGLIGWNNGPITDVYETGSVDGTGNLGGLVGINVSSISNAHATGPVGGEYLTGINTGDDGQVTLFAGGLVALNEGVISNSYATGGATCFCSNSIDAPGYGDILYSGSAGGLVADNNGMIRDSYATGNAAAPAGYDGAAVTASGGVGGLVGDNESSGTIVDSYSTGSASGVAVVGGLVGTNSLYGSPGITINSYWDTQTSGRSTSAGGVGLTTAQFASAANFTGFTFTTTPGGAGWVIVDQNGSLNNAGGAAGATRPLLASEYSTTISNAHQLQLMALNVAGSYTLAGNVSLAAISNPADVWITAEGFSPVGGSANWFTGSLGGAGYSINGLTINAAAAGLEHAGLFGVAGPSATIGDLSLTNVSVTGTTNVGALAGRVYSTTIGKVSAGGEVTGTVSVGGLIGYDNAAAVTGSSASTTVSGTAQLGGLIGWNSGALSGDSATGMVTASGAGVFALGGLVGVDYGAIGHSWASGAVSGGSGLIIGGLVGDDAGAITISYATGAVSGYGDVGGLAGRVRAASLSDDYASGSVTGIGSSAYDLGGFAGVTDAASSLTRVYATGSITGSIFTGGLVGYNNGALTDAYWNVQTSGLYNAVGGVPGAVSATGLTTAQMGHQASYAGWNFTTVWSPPAGGAPPTLR